MSLNRNGRPVPPKQIGYAITILLEIALTAGLLALLPHFPLARFPIPYVLAIMLVAYVFGEGPAALAFVLGLFAFDYFFVPPLHTIMPHPNTSLGSASLIAFMIGTAIVGVSMVLMRRSRRRIERTADALRESREDLNRAQAVAHTGSWRLDVRRNELLWSNEAYRMFGITQGMPLTYETFLASVHPEDRDFVDTAWKAALEGEPYDIEHRIIVGEDVKWVRERAELEFDEQGALLGGFGTVQDITERKIAEQKERELEEHKLEFYRRTIRAATEGKLEIVEKEEIRRIAGPPVASWEIKHASDLRAVRHGVIDEARALGMEEPRINRFVLCAGEAATTVVKHAKGGAASLHRLSDSLLFMVEDQGPGVQALNLPDLALTTGFSTAGTLGVGYKVMISFGDKVYLSTGAEGTTVAVEMRLHSSEEEPPVSMDGAWS